MLGIGGLSCKALTKEAYMMGHREKLKGGMEYDLAGHPEHRWRKYMVKRAGKWTYWKNKINRRNRKQAKAITLE